MSNNMLVWKRDPTLDTLEAQVDGGKYMCIRTFADVSKLWFYSYNGLKSELLGSWNIGSHEKAKQFAEDDYQIRRTVSDGTKNEAIHASLQVVIGKMPTITDVSRFEVYLKELGFVVTPIKKA